MGRRCCDDAVPGDLFVDERPVLDPAPVREWRVLSAASESGGGEDVPGAVRPGGPGGQEYSGGAQFETGRPHREERLMRKERNPARPAVTRLCGIYYGIKQKERRSGAAVDKPGLGIITGMWSSVGMC